MLFPSRTDTPSCYCRKYIISIITSISQKSLNFIEEKKKKGPAFGPGQMDAGPFFSYYSRFNSKSNCSSSLKTNGYVIYSNINILVSYEESDCLS
jgi:hypothetical protein